MPAGVLTATAVSTVVFAATPFLVRGVAVDQDVDVATVAIISTAQLAGFMLMSWGAGRFLQPRRRVLVIALTLGLLANAASALTPWFSLLVGIRFISGISLGLISWIAWSEVFGDDEKVGDVAVIGPIVGTISSPLIAILIDVSGSDLLFVVLAALHLAPLPFIRETKLVATSQTKQERHRPTRAAAAILGCLFLATFGGSAVFVFAAVIGQDEVGLGALAVSFAFSANALASVPSARYRGPPQAAGAVDGGDRFDGRSGRQCARADRLLAGAADLGILVLDGHSGRVLDAGRTIEVSRGNGPATPRPSWPPAVSSGPCWVAPCTHGRSPHWA